MSPLSDVLRRAAIVLVSALGSLVLTFCGAINVFPINEDKDLGARFDREIRANPAEYPIRKDPGARQYVQRIVDKILTSPEVKYRGTFAYKSEVIQDDKTINAFCTPGGYIYVYTGLLKLVDNEATLAGVLGHEIAHAELRHSTKRMTTQLGLETAMAIALGNNTNRNIELAANMFGGLGLLKNSRDDETDSDEYSFKYLKSTSWYPGGILGFFDKVKGRSAGGTLERLLSTHPLPDDRIKATQDRLKKANIPPPTEAQLNSRGYQEFKRTL